MLYILVKMYAKLNVIKRKINNWNIFSGTKCVSWLMDRSLPHLTGKVWLSLIVAKGQEHVSWQPQCNNKVWLLFPRSTYKSWSCAIVYWMQSKFRVQTYIFHTQKCICWLMDHSLKRKINLNFLPKDHSY